MIHISHETLIPLREAPRHLPCRPDGKRVHISAFYRWVSVGVRGVRLESLKVGGTTYTSLEALQRFAVQLSRPEPTSSGPSQRSRDRAIAVSQRLELELNLSPGRLAGQHKERT
jgi:Protein of unknown function (DUF1580)